MASIVTTLIPLLTSLMGTPEFQKVVSGLGSKTLGALQKTLAQDPKYRRSPLKNQVNEAIGAPKMDANKGVDVVNSQDSSILEIPGAIRYGSTMQSSLRESSLKKNDPFQDNFEGGLHLDGTEFLGYVSLAGWIQDGKQLEAGRTLVSFYLNPLNFIGSSLEKIALQYQRYCFTKVEVIYTPDVSATTNGSLIMAILTDASCRMDEVQEDGIRRLSSITGAEKFQVFQPTSMTRDLKKPECAYYLRTASAGTVMGNLVNQAKLIIKAGSTMEAVQYGALHLKYSLCLYDRFTGAISSPLNRLKIADGVVQTTAAGTAIKIAMAGLAGEDAVLIPRKPFVRDNTSGSLVDVGTVLYCARQDTSILGAVYTNQWQWLIGVNNLLGQTSSGQTVSFYVYTVGTGSNDQPLAERTDLMSSLAAIMHLQAEVVRLKAEFQVSRNELREVANACNDIGKVVVDLTGVVDATDDKSGQHLPTTVSEVPIVTSSARSDKQASSFKRSFF